MTEGDDQVQVAARAAARRVGCQHPDLAATVAVLQFDAILSHATRPRWADLNGEDRETALMDADNLVTTVRELPLAVLAEVLGDDHQLAQALEAARKAARHLFEADRDSAGSGRMGYLAGDDLRPLFTALGLDWPDPQP